MVCCLSYSCPDVIVIPREAPPEAIAQRSNCCNRIRATAICSRKALAVTISGSIALANLIMALVRHNKQDDGQVMTKALLALTVPLFMNAALSRPINQETQFGQRCGIGLRTISWGFALFPPMLAAASLGAETDELTQVSQKIMPPLLVLSVFFRALPEFQRCHQHHEENQMNGDVELGAVPNIQHNNFALEENQ